MRAVMTETKKLWVSGWLWWGGDCEQCLSHGGLHYTKPAILPPLHPNCDCVVGPVELFGGMGVRLEEYLGRSRRLVREIKLVLGDGSISEREREELVLCRRKLDEVIRQAVEAGRLTAYHLDDIRRMLREAEMESSRVKYRLSLEAANTAVSEEDKIEGTYSNEALDKATEFHFLLKEAAKEFKANLRAVEAAFADEYGRRRVKDELQDHAAIGATILRKLKLPIGWGNDFGLSNIDSHTAVRLQHKYNIEIPEWISLEMYLCTDKGCARFTAAAIREAQDELRSYNATLPAEKRAIMDSLNRDEMDALLVTIYKRGVEKEIKNLDQQLTELLEKRSRQKYLYIGEGYLAWCLWVREGG